jgi:hypothetical protein
MKTYTVLLDDGTVGEMTDDCLDGQHADAFIGEIVRVKHHDENGLWVESEGKLVETLDEK